MPASNHKHAPWRKVVLVPFWVLQLLIELFLIVVSALSIDTLMSWEDDEDLNEDVVDKIAHTIVAVWIGVVGLCLILTITEIILLARHKLKPSVFVIMNVIKSGIWVAVFVLDVVSVTASHGRNASALTLIFDAGLLLCFLIPLIYGSVIYHRFRREKRTYKPVDHPLSNPTDFGYPSQYKNLVQAHTDVEADANEGRRLSYNHQRDTRFDAYRQDRNSYNDIGLEATMGSPPIPQVHVEHHDGEVYEMENSRRNLT